jgi:hypothetical protein
MATKRKATTPPAAGKISGLWHGMDPKIKLLAGFGLALAAILLLLKTPQAKELGISLHGMSSDAYMYSDWNYYDGDGHWMDRHTKQLDDGQDQGSSQTNDANMDQAPVQSMSLDIMSPASGAKLIRGRDVQISFQLIGSNQVRSKRAYISLQKAYNCPSSGCPEMPITNVLTNSFGMAGTTWTVPTDLPREYLGTDVNIVVRVGETDNSVPVVIK